MLLVAYLARERLANQVRVAVNAIRKPAECPSGTRLARVLAIAVLGLPVLAGGKALGSPRKGVGTGEDRGVVISSTKADVVTVALTPRVSSALRRSILRKQIKVRCATVIPAQLGGFQEQLVAGAPLVGRTKMRVQLPVHGVTFDYCNLLTRQRRSLAAVAFDVNARVFLDERATTLLLFRVLDEAFAPDETSQWRFVSPDVLAIRAQALTVIAPLPDQSSTPPQGAVGYWTDGHQHATLVKQTVGRRLFVDLTGSSLSTNTTAYLKYVFGSP